MPNKQKGGAEYDYSNKYMNDTQVRILMSYVKKDQIRNPTTSINFYNNNITDEGAKEIASALPSMRALKHLILSHNKIRSLGAIAIADSMISIIKTGMVHDDSDYIINTIEKKIQGINLEDTDSRAIAVSQIASNFGFSSQLITFDMSHNNIGDSGAMAIAKALTNMKSLEIVRLDHINVQESSIIIIVNSLAQMRKTRLTELSLFSNNISDDASRTINYALPNFKKLKILDLAFNNINIDRITDGLSKMKLMEDLSLSYNYISGENSAQSFANALSCMKKLKTLKIANNYIGKDKIIIIANSLSKLTSLTYLNLMGNNIETEGAIAIANILPFMKELSNLDLSNNLIGTEGIIAIANAYYPENNSHVSKKQRIRSFSNKLTKLHLCNNIVGDNGAIAISKMTQLEELYLTFTDIEDEGAKNIVLKLKNLKSLSLAENNISDAIANDIINNLPKLKELMLYSTLISDAKLKELEETDRFELII